RRNRGHGFQEVAALHHNPLARKCGIFGEPRTGYASLRAVRLAARKALNSRAQLRTRCAPDGGGFDHCASDSATLRKNCATPCRPPSWERGGPALTSTHRKASPSCGARCGRDARGPRDKEGWHGFCEI